jgi:hypothetical protein
MVADEFGEFHRLNFESDSEENAAQISASGQQIHLVERR